MTTAVAALPLLFAGIGSGVIEPPDAVLVSVPLGGAVTVMVKFVPLPAGRSIVGQVTTPLVFVPPLNLSTMYGQSNDLFYAPERAIDLFDAKGNPVSGDVTDKFLLWDAGTEVNQAPGLGADQGPRQKAPNTGADENGVVRLVNDGFTYPNTKDVLKVTITVK